MSHKLLITPLMIVAFLSLTHGQVGPVSWPEFIDLEPLWTYKYEEPSVHPDSTFDRHISISKPRLYKHEDELILFTSNQDYRNISGNTIINLNPDTGEENCRYASNHFTGLPRYEYFNEVKLHPSGLMDLVGVERIDTSEFSAILSWSWAWNQNVKFKMKQINVHDCTELFLLTNMNDSLGFYAAASPRKYMFSLTTKSNRYLTYAPKIYYSAKYVFAELDELLTIDSTTLSDLTIFENNPDSFDIQNQILYRGDNYILTFIKQQNETIHFEHPERSEVLKINFENLDDIHVEHTTDITDLSYDEFFGLTNPLQWHYPQDEDNDNFLLNRAYLRSAGSSGWIVWMDKEGNIKTNFHKVTVDDHQYYWFQKININDEYCDLLAFPTSSGYEGYDVIRITIDGEVTKRGELVTAVDESEFIAEVSAQQIGDKVIVSGRPTPRYNLVVYAFDAADLGLDVLDSTKDSWIPNATKLKAYPNPAKDNITIDLPDGIIITQYEVVAYDGKRQMYKIDHKSTKLKVDVNQLSAGLYLLRCRDTNGKIYTAEFIKL